MDDLRIGLVARADVTGLGIQTRDFYRHMKPDYVVILDLSHLSGRPINPSWYPDAKDVIKYVPYPETPVLKNPDPATKDALDRMIQQVDLIFSCETVYDYYLIHAARKKGVKVVLQYNYELLDHIYNPKLPQPDLFMAPSLWHYDEVPFPHKVFVPVPVDREMFPPMEWESPVINRWIHPGGNPVMEDRNGTRVAMDAWEHTKSNARLTVTTPDPRVHSRHQRVTVTNRLAKEPQDNYRGQEGFIFPRKFGGLCLPLNEALSLGMPTVMSRVSPQQDFLHPAGLVDSPVDRLVFTKTDIEVHEPNVEELAQIVDRLTEDEDLVAEMRQHSARIGMRLSWPKMIPYYEYAFRTICGGRIPDQDFHW